MPYSISVQEKERFIQKLISKLPKNVVARQSKTTNWDAGLDGWIFEDKDSGKKIATLVGFGDRITTNGLIKIPYWLDSLIFEIRKKYPSDGIYVNGKIYTDTIQDRTAFLNKILKKLGYTATEMHDDSWFGGWTISSNGIFHLLDESLIEIADIGMTWFKVDRKNLKHRVVLKLAEEVSKKYNVNVEIVPESILESPSAK